MEHLLYPQKRGPRRAASVGRPTQATLGPGDASLVVPLHCSSGRCGAGDNEREEDARRAVHGWNGVLSRHG
jgi:hypothetical protein